jgi:sec-independent protein translocase protein TatA
MTQLPLAFIQNLGWPELLIILLIVILLFGHRLPGIGRALGKSVSEFKGGLKEGQEEAEKEEAKKKEGAVSKEAAQVSKEKAQNN